MKLKIHLRDSLYIRSMGKALEIRAIATTDDEANELCEKNDSLAVVAEFPPFIFLADKYDHGAPIPRSVGAKS